MNCAEIRLLLHAHADGELDAANSLELTRHLNACAKCAAEFKSLQALSQALRSRDLRHPAPDSLKRDLQLFVWNMQQPEPRVKVNAAWLWRWLTVGAMGFALVAILLRPAGMSSQDALWNEAVSSHVRSLQAAHLTDVVSSDQHTVKPWFDGKLDFAPDVSDFAADGFPLAGGRLDYLQNRPVAALVYRHNKHFINVFIWPAPGTAKFKTAKIRGYSVSSGTQNGMGFCLVSDVNEVDLGKLAELLTR